LGQINISRAIAKFFWQKTAAKNEQKDSISNENVEFISPSKTKCPKSDFSAANYWVGKSVKVI